MTKSLTDTLRITPVGAAFCLDYSDGERQPYRFNRAFTSRSAADQMLDMFDEEIESGFDPHHSEEWIQLPQVAS